ncbi:hypothetical protein B5C34_14645 [Pacificimonas flava]|uniref:Type II secretion system protein K n=2 Tax=Pacificimonas TaxID=1960290 RepID=A0A219B1N9_9SPHN|nr:hypothetical protein B5C34_14645 [Pacificimonas flava]
MTGPRCARRPGGREEGMALLTVLMLVGVMGALTVITLERMNRALAMTTNSRSAAQGHHYARGAALVAAERIETMLAELEGPLTLAGGWEEAPMTVPTAGGAITIRLSDASHCFNVNGLVTGSPGGATRMRPDAITQFAGLARGVGIGAQRAQQMAMSLVDYIDSDTYPQAGGAEDGAYSGYRAPNMPVAATGELMAVANWNAADYELLKPFLCALPTTDMQPINVNTLSEADAPLLGMLVPSGVSVAAARRLIAGRPAAGWGSQAEFWADARAIGAMPLARAQYQVDVTSNLFRADIEVEDGGFAVRESALIRLGGAAGEGGAHILRRSWSGAA